MGRLKDKSVEFAKKKAYENKWGILKFLLRHGWARKIVYKSSKNILRKKIRNFFD